MFGRYTDRDSAFHVQIICRSARIKTSLNSRHTILSAAAKSLYLKRLLLQTMTACKRRPSRLPKKESKESEKSPEKMAAKYATKLNIALLWANGRRRSISSCWNKKEKLLGFTRIYWNTTYSRKKIISGRPVRNSDNK